MGSLKKINRMLENGSKQLCAEIKTLVREKEILIDALRGIKKEYDIDFTEQELQELQPRDDYIYSTTIKALDIVDI